ncbi:carbonic anhydrase [Sphingobium sp. CFD-2]|uniref:carbonic anhydrase n=1 Tax=Sphingobium sp. CFD-2 TaxID=2878542 RepID=UPI00214B1600|nr:carbonic anhydrase [Sphingobium sp. CFD-2]
MRAEDEGQITSLARSADGLGLLFERNRAWAEAKTHADPTFFSRLVGQQRPRYFWIGCSDSRVPATEIVDLDPGEMFVHRNVANLASEDDPSFAAALQFAVEILEVEHIIVVGHYGCGGIHAAMGPQTCDAIGRWLTPVRRVYRGSTGEEECVPIDADELCECNVRAQVEALSRNSVVRQAWRRSMDLTLHGWAYSIGDGRLQPVCDPVKISSLERN